MHKMTNLNFKDYLENAAWKPATPVFHEPDINPEKTHGTKHTTTVDISNSFKPMHPANFKGLTAKDFGSKIKRVPKPKI